MKGREGEGGGGEWLEGEGYRVSERWKGEVKEDEKDRMEYGEINEQRRSNGNE